MIRTSREWRGGGLSSVGIFKKCMSAIGSHGDKGRDCTDLHIIRTPFDKEERRYSTCGETEFLNIQLYITHK